MAMVGINLHRSFLLRTLLGLSITMLLLLLLLPESK
jgi:hypothetical protein